MPIDKEEMTGAVGELEVSHDPFAPDNLLKMRLSQDFNASASVKPVLTTIAVRKPSKHEFVRVRAGAEWRFETYCFVEGESREVYLLKPEIWAYLQADARPTALVLTISRLSPVPFLWPVSLPTEDRRPCRWHTSAIEASLLAEQNWVRVVSDLAAGSYGTYVAEGELSAPCWPDDMTMTDYLRLAFRDRVISDMSHPCLKRLRGEI